MKIKVYLFILLSVLSFSVSSGQKANKKSVVSGLVSDPQQKPVAGALIFVDGKNTNISTNNNGLYKIKVRPDADSITIFTYNNGISTVAINGRTIINFTLVKSGTVQQGFRNNPPKNESVDVGYGNIDKKNLSTPVSTIDGRSGKYASYKDIYEILRKTPGVRVTGNSVKIEGVSSFFAGTDPLFVVDDVPVQSIDWISPMNVKSISVLKGSSTSIYGSRGANGVILIYLLKGSQK